MQSNTSFEEIRELPRSELYQQLAVSSFNSALTVLRPQNKHGNGVHIRYGITFQWFVAETYREIFVIRAVPRGQARASSRTVHPATDNAPDSWRAHERKGGHSQTSVQWESRKKALSCNSCFKINSSLKV